MHARVSVIDQMLALEQVQNLWRLHVDPFSIALLSKYDFSIILRPSAAEAFSPNGCGSSCC